MSVAKAAESGQGQRRQLAPVSQKVDFTRRIPDEHLRRITHSPDGSIILGRYLEERSETKAEAKVETKAEIAANTKRTTIKSNSALYAGSSTPNSDNQSLQSSPPADSQDSAKVSFSLVKKNSYVASAGVFSSQDIVETANTENNIVLPPLEEHLATEDAPAEIPRERQKVFSSFLEVKNKDGTRTLNWPVDMVQHTKTLPSLSFSCNPLMVDLAVLLRGCKGATGHGKMEVQNPGERNKCNSQVDGLVNDGENNLKDIQARNEKVEVTIGPKVKKAKKRKKKHKRKKSENHEKEKAGNDKKEKAKKKRKHKKRKRKHKKNRAKVKAESAGSGGGKSDGQAVGVGEIAKVGGLSKDSKDNSRKRSVSEKSDGSSPLKKIKRETHIQKDRKSSYAASKDRDKVSVSGTSGTDKFDVKLLKNDQQRIQQSETDIENRLLEKMKRLKSVKSDSVGSALVTAVVQAAGGKIANCVDGVKVAETGLSSRDARESIQPATSWSKMEDILEEKIETGDKKPSWETSSESEADDAYKSGRSKRRTAERGDATRDRSNSCDRDRSAHSGSRWSSYSRSRSRSSYRTSSYASSRSRSYSRSRSSRYTSTSRSRSASRDSRRSRSSSRHDRSHSSSRSRSRSASYSRSRSRSRHSRSSSAASSLGRSRSISVDKLAVKTDRDSDEGKQRSDLVNPLDIPLPIIPSDDSKSSDKRLQKIKETKERIKSGRRGNDKGLCNIPLPPLSDKTADFPNNMKNLENLPVIDYTKPPPPVFGPLNMPDDYHRVMNPPPPPPINLVNRGATSSKQAAKNGASEDPPLPPPKSPPPKPPPDETKNPEAMQVDIDPQQAEQYRQLQKQAEKHAKKLRKQRREERGEAAADGDPSESSDDEDDDDNDDRSAAGETIETKSEVSENMDSSELETLVQQSLLDAAAGMSDSPTFVYANQPQLLAAGMPLQAGSPLMYPLVPQASLTPGLIPQAITGGFLHPAAMPQLTLIPSSGLSVMAPGFLPVRQILSHPLLPTQATQQPMYRILRPPW